jgi:hypothetical protein
LTPGAAISCGALPLVDRLTDQTKAHQTEALGRILNCKAILDSFAFLM